MSVFVAKTYFTEDSSSILGIFTSIDLAKNSVERAYPIKNAIDYLIVEIPLDSTEMDEMKSWEYQGNWVVLS